MADDIEGKLSLPKVTPSRFGKGPGVRFFPQIEMHPLKSHHFVSNLILMYYVFFRCILPIRYYFNKNSVPHKKLLLARPPRAGVRFEWFSLPEDCQACPPHAWQSRLINQNMGVSQKCLETRQPSKYGSFRVC